MRNERSSGSGGALVVIVLLVLVVGLLVVCTGFLGFGWLMMRNSAQSINQVASVTMDAPQEVAVMAFELDQLTMPQDEFAANYAGFLQWRGEILIYEGEITNAQHQGKGYQYSVGDDRRVLILFESLQAPDEWDYLVIDQQLVDSQWLKHGEQFLIKSGGVLQHTEFQNGVEHGQDEAFYANGQKQHEQTYANGKLHGHAQGWYESGAKQWMSNYVNGEEVSGMRWEEDGTPK